jgi:glycosyltransferase involved in cell wall biosynthesis
MTVTRIVYVEQNTDGTIGGSHYCLLDLVKHLDRRRFDPIVAFYGDHALLAEFEKVCPTVILPAFRPIGPLGTGTAGARWIERPVRKGVSLFTAYLPAFFSRLAFIRRHRIDIVHLNNSIMRGYDWLTAARFAGVACITHNRRRPDVTTLRKFFIRRFDRIVYLADWMVDELRRQGVTPDDRYVKIHDGMDPEYITGRVRDTREGTRRSLGIAPAQPVIGIVGNIKRWKGQDVVVRAAALLKERYPDLVCLMIGDTSNIRGDDKAYFDGITAYIGEHGLADTIRFLGYREDVPDLMRCVDVLINASTEPEPFGHVLLEGMALGASVVATNFGGSPEIIEHGVSGLLVDPGDEADLARAVNSLLEDEALRGRIGEAAEARVDERFLLSTNVSETEALYMTLRS